MMDLGVIRRVRVYETWETFDCYKQYTIERNKESRLFRVRPSEATDSFTLLTQTFQNPKLCKEAIDIFGW